VVIGADSQESTGVARRSTHKLIRPQQGLLLAWAGYKDVAQAFALSLQEEPLRLTNKRSEVAKAAQHRFRQIRDESEAEHRTDTNEFMLGWFSEDDAKPVALHLHPLGRFVWIEEWEYAGSPQAVSTARAVEASLSYLVTEDLTVEQLSLVVLKVVRDSIAAAGPQAMIGGEVQLASVTTSGVHLLEPNEIRAASDALDVWHDQCAELLPGSVGRQSVTEPADRGLRPPE
jgi:hypothetical protein